MICFFYIGFTYGKNRVISEVIDFSDDLQEASADIRSQLDMVEENIETINSIGSFSVKAAKEGKQYFCEMNLKILQSLTGLDDDHETYFQQNIHTLGSDVDGRHSCLIKSNYLQDGKENINEIFEDVEKQDEIIHDTIKEVSDISSATPPSFSDVDEWIK